MFLTLQGILQKHLNPYALGQSQSRSASVFSQVAQVRSSVSHDVPVVTNQKL